MKHKELPKVEPVRIKPLFGLKPGLWLTILYAIILALFIFFVCFLPGIINGGKRVTFTSKANKAAVYVDNKYQGGTPFTRFVSSGSHTVEFKVNEVLLDTQEIKVGHPVFMTWMFPRKMSVNSAAVLNKEAYDALLTEFFTDLGAYSAIMEYDSVFRYPELYTDFVKTVSTSPFNANLNEVLENASFFVTTKEMESDFIRACELAGLNIKPGSTDSSTFSARNLKNYSSDISLSQSKLSVGNIEIKGFFTGTYNISQNLVSEYLFAEFLKDCPEWAIKEALLDKELVDSYYLAGVNLSTSVNTNKYVKNVSCYAAKAFCSWLSEKTGKTVSLPTEKQLIECSKSSSSILGSVWQLTDSDYIPHVAENDFVKSTGAKLETIIKGSSALDVGTSPKSLCSEYMGFRIVWN